MAKNAYIYVGPKGQPVPRSQITPEMAANARPLQDMSDEELNEIIQTGAKMGLKPTSDVTSAIADPTRTSGAYSETPGPGTRMPYYNDPRDQALQREEVERKRAESAARTGYRRDTPEPITTRYIKGGSAPWGKTNTPEESMNEVEVPLRHLSDDEIKALAAAQADQELAAWEEKYPKYNLEARAKELIRKGHTRLGTSSVFKDKAGNLTVLPTQEDEDWRRLGLREKSLENKWKREEESRKAREGIDARYWKGMERAKGLQMQDRLEREFQEIERKLKGYQGIPEGLKDVTDYGADTPDALQRRKYSILNALMGKGIDVKEAIPERKAKPTASQPFTTSDGRIFQYDKDGKLSVIDPLKPDQPKKIPMNPADEAQLKAALERLTNDKEDTVAQALVDAIVEKYGGVKRPSVETGLLGGPASQEAIERMGATLYRGGAGSRKAGVVRTGTDKRTGRKVVMYEDGTVEYAD